MTNAEPRMYNKENWICLSWVNFFFTQGHGNPLSKHTIDIHNIGSCNFQQLRLFKSDWQLRFLMLIFNQKA